MDIYIMADIEGISGIYCRDQVVSGGSRAAEGRRYMTDEVNVCVEAARAAGAERVYVRDAHGRSETLIWEDLSPLAEGYVCGRAENQRMPLLDRCGGLILLGYHAMAGTAGAVLEHTMSSAAVQSYRVNGRTVGEIAVDAAIAGEHGVPVLLVTGDDKACREAEEFLPGVLTCSVKMGLSTEGCVLLPRETAHKRLREAVQQAVTRPAPPLFAFEKPLRFQVELTERTPLPSALGKPYLRLLDGRTYEVTADTMETALFLA